MNQRTQHPSIPLDAAAAAALLFGLLTIRSGGGVLFGGEGSDAGAVVSFVVWFNFLAGFAYVAVGVGLWLRRRWAGWLAVVVGVATLVTFAAFGFHVASGGAYEMRTTWALTVRSIVWVALAVWACWSLGCLRKHA